VLYAHPAAARDTMLGIRWSRPLWYGVQASPAGRLQSA
jgi:hypothetical protein